MFTFFLQENNDKGASEKATDKAAQMPSTNVRLRLKKRPSVTY